MSIDFTTMTPYPPGFFSRGWNLIARDDSRGYPGPFLFYNALTGSGATGALVWSSTVPGSLAIVDFKPLKSYPDKSFSIGWTHLVSTGAGLFYYNASDGSAALGEIDWVISGEPSSGTHRTLHSWSGRAFAPHWSRIVAFGTLVLFYNGQTGEIVIREIHRDGTFGIVAAYAAGEFSPGWSDLVVENGHVLFYRRSSGEAAVGVLSAGGLTVLRNEGPGTMASGWTHLAPISGSQILCYDRVTGSAAVEYMYPDGTGRHATEARWGPGHFSAGWTHIELSGPLLFYNGTTGSAAIATVRT